MPYTPPSRSPASSAPTSPEGSRRPSFHQPQNATSRPHLPKSSSYLTRHRRTPPAVVPASACASEPSPEATSEDLKCLVAATSVRQSPPPITGDRGMPNGAIISPPDSSSDDDDMPEVCVARGRQIENLKELHDAVSQIPQQGPRLPSDGDGAGKEASDAGDLLVLPEQANAIAGGMHHSYSTSSLDGFVAAGHRRFSHMRSATEPRISISKSAGSSVAGSEEDSDEEQRRKPQMVRKKSGELVRPALRPASRRRPSSMPGTPTFSKAVHFDSHLEHVRHFLKVDRPLAVSAGSSPVDNYESDNEYPFSADERPASRPLPFEWEIVMTNFPLETPVRKARPVRLERVWLSNDQKCLVGSVAVANFAFQKLVVCRFTLDYWKTTSEITAEYVCEIRPVDTPHGQDRFNFTIKLSDLAHLESKTLYFCIRYNVNGQQYWDNNNGTNFQVDFRKKLLPQNGKKGALGAAPRPLNGLPKSNRRPTLATIQKKPAGFGADDFGENPKLDYSRSIHEYLGESAPTGLRLKGVRSAGNLSSDNLSAGLAAPSGQLSHRYDFGNSLSRAIQSAKDKMVGKPDGLYMKTLKRSGSPMVNSADSVDKTELPATANADRTTAAEAASSPPDDSPRASMSSASYQEIVNKWCFYSSKQKSPQATSTAGRSDAADDESRSTSSGSTASYDSSPVQALNYYHSHSGTQHHALHPDDPNPYFRHFSALRAMGASPTGSPLDTLSPQGMGSPLSGSSVTPSGSSHSPQPHALGGNFAPFAVIQG